MTADLVAELRELIALYRDLGVELLAELRTRRRERERDEDDRRFHETLARRWGYQSPPRRRPR